MKIHLASSVALAFAVAVAGCGHGSRNDNASGKRDKSDTTATQPAGTTGSSPVAPASSTGRVARGPAIGKIRVINTIAVNGAPGPAIDLYDISRPDAGTKPLIANLQYGQVSEYVTPHGWTAGDTHSYLYALPAGSKTPGGVLTGSNIDNGYDVGDQLTLALHATDLGFGNKQFTEAGRHVRPGMQMDPTPPAGKGVLLVREATSKVGDEREPVMYLSVDGTCENTLRGIEGAVPVAPGDHTLALLTNPPGMGISQGSCADKKPVASATTHVDAGHAVDVVIYGPPAALKLLVAPVEK